MVTWKWGKSKADEPIKTDKSATKRMSVEEERKRIAKAATVTMIDGNKVSLHPDHEKYFSADDYTNLEIAVNKYQKAQDDLKKQRGKMFFQEAQSKQLAARENLILAIDENNRMIEAARNRETQTMIAQEQTVQSKMKGQLDKKDTKKAKQATKQAPKQDKKGKRSPNRYDISSPSNFQHIKHVGPDGMRGDSDGNSPVASPRVSQHAIPSRPAPQPPIASKQQASRGSGAYNTPPGVNPIVPPTAPHRPIAKPRALKDDANRESVILTSATRTASPKAERAELPTGNADSRTKPIPPAIKPKSPQATEFAKQAGIGSRNQSRNNVRLIKVQSGDFTSVSETEADKMPKPQPKPQPRTHVNMIQYNSGGHSGLIT